MVGRTVVRSRHDSGRTCTGAILIAFCLVVTPDIGVAQVAVSVTGNLAAYDGGREQGVGGGVFAEITRSAGVIQVRGHGGITWLHTIGQTCTTGVPASCSPESPASPLFQVGGAAVVRPYRGLEFSAGPAVIFRESQGFQGGSPAAAFMGTIGWRGAHFGVRCGWAKFFDENGDGLFTVGPTWTF